LKTLSVLLQRVFFGGVKVLPKPIWQKRAQQMGHLRTGTVPRNNGDLSFIHLEPDGDNNINKIVILSHPISRKGKYFFTESKRAQPYLNKGYSVVAFDYNGFGESDRIDLFYWRDVAAIIEYVKAQFPHKRITLHGASFGAFHIARALNHLPSNAYVIFENVNKSLWDYWKRWPVTSVLVRVLELTPLRAIRDMDIQAVFKEFTRDDLHIQFIACEQDDVTTLQEMQELYEVLRSSNKSFTLIEDAGHLAAPTKNPTLYNDVLTSGGCTSC
jgi:fermentation-respiration switch protein FrsA (DUF1100 family)